jgi:hypothetical protein
MLKYEIKKKLFRKKHYKINMFWGGEQHLF